MEIQVLKNKVTPILRKAGVRRAALFGSVARSQDRSSSDIDILVELNEQFSLLDFVDLKYKLEASLNRKVDMVEYGAIKKSIRENVLADQVMIY